MKLIFLLSINIFFVKSSILYEKVDKSSEKNETFLLAEIISNYIHKYFSDERVFLSITLCSSSIDQKYHQANLVHRLISDNSKLDNFTYNVLSTLDRSRRGNTNAFNLILIDKSASLT